MLNPIFRKDALFSEKAFRNLSGKVVEQLRKRFMPVEVQVDIKSMPFRSSRFQIMKTEILLSNR